MSAAWYISGWNGLLDFLFKGSVADSDSKRYRLFLFWLEIGAKRSHFHQTFKCFVIFLTQNDAIPYIPNPKHVINIGGITAKTRFVFLFSLKEQAVKFLTCFAGSVDKRGKFFVCHVLVLLPGDGRVKVTTYD